MNKVKFSEPLLHLHIIGFSPLTNDRFAFLRRLIAVSVLLTTFVSITSELSSNFTEFSTVARASEAIFPFYQNIWKLLVLTVHKRELMVSITKSEQFWPLGQFGESYATINYSKHAFLRKFYLMYRTGLALTSVMFIYMSFVTDKPMVLSYGEEEGFSQEMRLFYHVLHNLLLIVIVNLIAGFDGLLFYLIAHVLSELKMISVAFSQSKIKPLWSHKRRLQISVKHHIFALQFVKRLNKIYFMFLLNDLIASLFALCFGLYLLTEKGLSQDYKHLSKYIGYVISYLVQVWMFCFAGDLIAAWSLEISDQLFYEDWMLNNAYKYKIDKVIVIKRAQTPARLTLGGFGYLELRTFTLVINNALSFFMFVNTMIRKYQV